MRSPQMTRHFSAVVPRLWHRYGHEGFTDARITDHSAEPAAAGNSRHAWQLTVYENLNIIIGGHARFRRLRLS